jgi:hypothetical protein
MKPFSTGIIQCLGFSLLISLVSCVKSTSPVGTSGTSDSSNPSNSSYLSSIRSNSSLLPQVDSFTYDGSNRLMTIIVIATDSFSSSSGAEARVTFTYSGSNAIPASYTIDNPNGTNGLHQLYYDGQNRVIKDTALDGTGVATKWSYPNGNIVSIMGGASGEQTIDTLFFDNGNLTARHSYIANNAGTADTLLGSTQYTYTSIVNPCYHQAIAGTFGPLLNNLVIDGGYTDFVSGYGISTATISASSIGLHGLPSPESTQTFAWTTDSKGRAAILKVTDSQLGAVGN